MEFVSGKRVWAHFVPLAYTWYLLVSIIWSLLVTYSFTSFRKSAREEKKKRTWELGNKPES